MQHRLHRHVPLQATFRRRSASCEGIFSIWGRRPVRSRLAKDGNGAYRSAWVIDEEADCLPFRPEEIVSALLFPNLGLVCDKVN